MGWEWVVAWQHCSLGCLIRMGSGSRIYDGNSSIEGRTNLEILLRETLQNSLDACVLP